jgi:hypothetical protein
MISQERGAQKSGDCVKRSCVSALKTDSDGDSGASLSIRAYFEAQLTYLMKPNRSRVTVKVSANNEADGLIGKLESQQNNLNPPPPQLTTFLS